MIMAFRRIGGEEKLRAIIDTFVERMYADAMIGFFFRNVPQKRIKELEYQHAAAFLGAPVAYRGRELGEAHGKHPIMGGHFNRRRQILKNTLEENQIPQDVIDMWMAHIDSLRGEIVRGKS
jgi:hemoglobin